MSAATAFGAYCFVEEPALYRSVEDEMGFFYVDPLTMIGIKEDYYREDRFSAAVKEKLKKLSKLGYEQSRNIRVEDLIRQ